MSIRIRVALVAVVAAALVTQAGQSQTLAELSANLPPGVKVIEELDRYMFTTSDGMPLYFLDDDKKAPGTSTCLFLGPIEPEAHCAWTWPPLFAPDDAAPVGDWSTIKRPEGRMQWAYKGMPLYLNEEDFTPGIDSGDNTGQRWHTLVIARPPPSPVLPPGIKVINGGNDWLLADLTGRRLFAVDNPLRLDRQSCSPDCITQLAPLPAPMLARTVGGWQALKGRDGNLQWSYKGALIYLFADAGPPDDMTEKYARPVSASR
jgi:predicted lipoprotein with Yx(FWY)xxD motif